jgi:hypothetical protein
MDNSKRTGGHGRGINTGKNMAEKNGMERIGRMIGAEAEEKVKENTAIRPRQEMD